MPKANARKAAGRGDQAVGVLMLDHALPFIPGSVGNAESYRYPTRFRVVPGLTFQRVFDRDPLCAALLVEAARELESEGVGGIASNCGFMLHYQEQVAGAVRVPVFLSSLMQLPLIAASCGHTKPIGIIAAEVSGLDNAGLDRLGVAVRAPVIAKGMGAKPEFRRFLIDMCGTLDADLLRRETIEVARELHAECPDLAAILLECSELPPYAAAVQEATGLPTYDFMTMIDFFHAAMQRHPYPVTH